MKKKTISQMVEELNQLKPGEFLRRYEKEIFEPKKLESIFKKAFAGQNIRFLGINSINRKYTIFDIFNGFDKKDRKAILEYLKDHDMEVIDLPDIMTVYPSYVFPSFGYYFFNPEKNGFEEN